MSAARKAAEVLAQAIRDLPASEQGAYFHERFDQDGNYLGAEPVQTETVVQMLHGAIEEARALLAETGATPDVAEEVSAVRHRIDNGRRCRDCGEAIGITAYADDLLDKFAQAPAPPAASDEVREAAERYRVASAALRAENERLAGALHSLARIETDEEGLPVLVISCGFHCQTSDQTELPLVWAALSRPAAKGGHE